ncbi:MAG: ATP-binding cassette domain-containing protein [Bacteroidales bacterium]|nr:ATP-binding cassette domain-containing protein [Bacteroidales bacterium]
MLIIKDVGFAYNQANTFRFPDFRCQRGEHWLIMGASGCGKTTLLHLMAGLLKPVQGEVSINGIRINNISPAQLDKFRGKEIGVVLQKHHFIQALNVSENLQVCRYLNGQRIKRKEILELLEQLNISDKIDSKINQLSQGELQRLSIARAVINKPSVIFADEPTSSLDDFNCTEALHLLKQEASVNNATLVIVTHDRRLLSHFKNTIELSHAKQ